MNKIESRLKKAIIKDRNVVDKIKRLREEKGKLLERIQSIDEELDNIDPRSYGLESEVDKVFSEILLEIKNDLDTKTD